MAGYTTSKNGVTISAVQLLTLIVRFWTPNTTTEVAKAIVPTTGVIAHVANDTTNSVSSANASDQATLNTLLNEIKADYNAHIASTTFHSNADTTNAVTSADSSSEATAVTLANEIKADYNAHLSQATIHPYNETRNVATSTDSTNLATAVTLANEIKGDYNSHRTSVVRTFYVYGIAPGTYDVGIKAENSASLLVEDVVFTPGPPITVNFGLTWQGDLNGDDYIDSGDTGICNIASSAGIVGQCTHTGWTMSGIDTFGDWTVIPTARRKTY